MCEVYKELNPINNTSTRLQVIKFFQNETLVIATGALDLHPNN